MLLRSKVILTAGLITGGIIALFLPIQHSTALKKNKDNCYLLTKAQSIKKSGCYVLANDIKAPPNKKIAIQVKANNVVIDLNSKSISKIGSRKDNIGIFAKNINHLEVRNGALKNFYNAIVLRNSEYLTVKNITLNKVNNIGIIVAQIKDSHIIGNKIKLNSFYPKTDPVDFYLVGINLVRNKNIVIKNNNISSTNKLDLNKNPSLEQVGILLSNHNNNVHLFNNSVHFLSLWPKTYGIWVGEQNRDIAISYNHISNALYGIISTAKNSGISIKHCTLTTTGLTTKIKKQYDCKASLEINSTNKSRYRLASCSKKT